MKKVILLSILFSVKLIAQTDESANLKKSYLGIKLGNGQISGDGTAKGGLSAGLEYEKQLSKLLIFGAGIDFGKLNGGPRAGYSYTSETSFMQASAKLKFDVLSKSKFKIIPFVGIGYINYNSKVSDGGKIVRFANGTADKTKSIGNLSFPAGIEIAINTKKGRFGLEFSQNYTQSDRLDGTIGVGKGGSFDGHAFKGKIVDLKKGTAGKTRNDEWAGIRLKYTHLLKSK